VEALRPTPMWFEHTFVNVLNRLGGPRAIPHQHGLRFGSLEPEGSPVIWPHARRAEHLCAVGKTGAGKTHFFEYLAQQLMHTGEPFLFLDYHGDATDHLVRLAANEPAVAERLLIVDPSDPHQSPGVNPLELDRSDERTVFARSSELAAILHQRWHVDAFGPRTEELLRNTLFVLAACGQTLVEASLFLTSPPFRQRLLSQVANPDILDYWLTRYEPLSESMKATFREALLNKITSLLTDPCCRHFLGQTRSTVRFAEAIDAGQWILVRLPKGILREHAHTLGNLLFARLQFDILARASVPAAQRRLVTVFADEVQNLAENDLATLLAEGRKFQVSLITGHQFWDQLPKELRGALLSAGTHVFFRISSSDAGALSGELSVAARQRYQRELTQLSRGQAIARIGAGGPLTLTVPPLPHARQSAATLAAVWESATARCSRPRTDIEAEIRARRSLGASPLLNDIHPHDDASHDGQQGW